MAQEGRERRQKKVFNCSLKHKAMAVERGGVEQLIRIKIELNHDEII